MNIKKILASAGIAILLVVAVLSDSGCKKQPKCGCDGDRLDSLKQVLGYISYNKDANSAQFTPAYDSYSIYYFCNPVEMMGELTKFSQGEDIFVSGEYFYDCTYLMNQSNSPYASQWRVYQIKVTAVAANDWGK